VRRLVLWRLRRCCSFRAAGQHRYRRESPTFEIHATGMNRAYRRGRITPLLALLRSLPVRSVHQVSDRTPRNGLNTLRANTRTQVRRTAEHTHHVALTNSVSRHAPRKGVAPRRSQPMLHIVFFCSARFVDCRLKKNHTKKIWAPPSYTPPRLSLLSPGV